MSRGNGKQCIFTDDWDYQQFLEILALTVGRFRVKCHGYCELWNHFHLLVTPSDLPLSRMMQHLNSKYSQWFNRRHGRVGHVLQGRYRGLLVDNASYFLHALRYVMLNPVAGRRAADPASWRWSSYAATAGIVRAPDFLFLGDVWKAFDARSASAGQRRFVSFINAAEGLDDLWGPLLMGSSTFAKQIDPLIQEHREDPAFLYEERYATRPPLAEILVLTNDREQLQESTRVAFHRHAYTLREIGDLVGRHPATVWDWIQRAHRRRVR
jgi:REP element-mobilizing transposase RayT